MNLNRASAERLHRFGLSNTQASRVIAYRERRDGFKSVDELDEIPGFSRTLLAELKQRSRVGPGRDHEKPRGGNPQVHGENGHREREVRGEDGAEKRKKREARAEKREARARNRSRDQLKQLGDPNIKTGRQLWVETVPKVIPYAKPYWKLVAVSIVLTL